MKQAIFMSIALGLVLILSPACNKNDDEVATPDCRMITAVITPSNGNPTTVNFSYNNDGDISVIQQVNNNNTTTKVFTYAADLIIITTSQGGSVTQTDSLKLNSNGLLASQVQRFNGSTSKTVNTFTYNANGQLLKTVTQSGSGTPQTNTYTFTNGDLTSATGSSNLALTYFPDKPFIDGDYLKILQVLNIGVLYIKNVHLVKSMQTGSSLQNFNYEFDDTGKVSKLTITTGSLVETVTYQYDCD
jgi:hypothetical protein